MFGLIDISIRKEDRADRPCLMSIVERFASRSRFFTLAPKRKKPRPYQESLISSTREAFRSSGVRCVLSCLPTGGGKTFVFCTMTASAVARGKKVSILAHRKELVRQISLTLAGMGVAHRLVAPRATIQSVAVAEREKLGQCWIDESAPVTVGSVQSVVRRLAELPRPDLAIVDEGHHATEGSAWGRCLEYWEQGPVRSILFTATPCRLDGTGLGRGKGGYADRIVCGPGVGELIDIGHLSPFTAYGTRHVPQLKGLRSRGGDWERKGLEIEMSRPALFGDAVEHYRRLCDQKPAVGFCVSVEHAIRTAKGFREVGIPAIHVDGALRPEERDRRLSEFAAGKYKILTSADLIGEGLDIPSIVAAILLRPTKSLSLFLQQVGRALRIADDKEQAFILDHAGNIARHGFPDEARAWTLDGVAKKETPGGGEVHIKTCEQCFVIYERRSGQTKCPACGAESAPATTRPIKQIEGRLEELKKREQRFLRSKAKTEDDLVRLETVKSRRQARHILRAREQKKELIARVQKKLDLWVAQYRTGLSSKPNVSRAKINKMKPKELQSLLERIDIEIHGKSEGVVRFAQAG